MPIIPKGIINVDKYIDGYLKCCDEIYNEKDFKCCEVKQ